jgi:hypothetical protein
MNAEELNELKQKIQAAEKELLDATDVYRADRSKSNKSMLEAHQMLLLTLGYVAIDQTSHLWTLPLKVMANIPADELVKTLPPRKVTLQRPKRVTFAGAPSVREFVIDEPVAALPYFAAEGPVTPPPIAA